MGLFGFLRKKNERAIPEPGTPEFEAAVQGTALPDAQSVSIGEALRDSGIDPDKKGQTINAASVPGLQEKIAGILGRVMRVPNAGGFGGGISPPKQDPLDQIAYLDQQRDAGRITDAEFEAQKKKLLDE